MPEYKKIVTVVRSATITVTVRSEQELSEQDIWNRVNQELDAGTHNKQVTEMQDNWQITDIQDASEPQSAKEPYTPHSPQEKGFPTTTLNTPNEAPSQRPSQHGGPQIGCTFGGLSPASLAHLWHEASVAGHRCLSLTISAGSDVRDEYHDLTVKVTGTQSWNEPRQFHVTDIEWDSDEVEGDHLPAEASIEVGAETDLRHASHFTAVIKAALKERFGYEVIHFGFAEERRAAERITLSAPAEGQVLWMTVDDYATYQEAPHSHANVTEDFETFTSAAEALEDSGWTQEETGLWTKAGQTHPTTEALKYADIVEIRPYNFTTRPITGTVYAFSRASAGHAAEELLEDREQGHDIQIL